MGRLQGEIKLFLFILLYDMAFDKSKFRIIFLIFLNRMGSFRIDPFSEERCADGVHAAGAPEKTRMDDRQI